MSAEFESIATGVADHIGNYADAVRLPAGVDVIHTSGTPGLRSDGTLPEDFSAKRPRKRGATSKRRWAGQALSSATSSVCGNG